MLEDYKESFRRCAEHIDGWLTMSKNDLCRQYVESEGNEELQNAYFSAIMYRYWNLIPKYYYLSNNVASPEDCYEWLEDSVVYTLKMSKWDDENSAIYKDPNGPDKIINRCMKCARLTFYQFINRKKRKDNFGMLSLDELSEQFGDTVEEPIGDDMSDNITKWAIQEKIKSLFLRKDYFTAVVLDCIQSQNVFDIGQDENKQFQLKFNSKKLTRFINNMNDTYVDRFAKLYELDKAAVIKGFSYFKNLKTNVIKAKIETCLERLQHDSFFIALHNGD